MGTYYLKESKNLDSIQNLKLVENIIKEDDMAISYDGKEYKVEKELSQYKTVYGYVEISKKENEKHKVNLKNVKASFDNRIAIEKERKERKIIGYLIILDKDGIEQYVALVEEKQIILLWLILLLIGIVSISIGVWIIKPVDNTEQVVVSTEKEDEEEVVFKDGEKGTGEIAKGTHEFQEQQTFRMRLNCTPTVENGYMNLRLESPAEDNEGLGFVVKVYLISKVDEESGAIIEKYDEDTDIIYESPIVYANEHIENCPLDTEIEQGMYEARAVYNIYDTDKNFVGQTATRLSIKVVN